MDWLKNKTLRTDWFGAFPKLGLYLILGWIASISTFLLSLMVGSFFDIHLTGLTGKGILLEKFGLKITQIQHLFIIMASVLVLKVGSQYWERKGINQNADLFLTRLQQRLFRRQLRWSPKLFSERPFSKYLLKYSGDLQPIRNLLVNGIHRGIRDIMFLLTGLGVLFWINWLWSLTLIGIGLMTLPIFILLDSRQLKIIPVKRTQKNDLLHLVADSFSKQSQLHQKNQVNRTVRKFNTKSEELLAINRSYQHLESLRHALVNGTGPFLILILLILLSWQWTEVSVGSLLAYLLVLGTLVSPIRNVIKAPEIIEKGMLSLRKIDRTLRKRERKKSLIATDETIPIVPLPYQDQKTPIPQSQKKFSVDR
jgi:ABC-type multidrug transport system fused ATPase/permease subunit